MPVRKCFDGYGWHNGTIRQGPIKRRNPLTDQDEDVWKVLYDDGDTEECNKDELATIVIDQNSTGSARGEATTTVEASQVETDAPTSNTSTKISSDSSPP